MIQVAAAYILTRVQPTTSMCVVYSLLNLVVIIKKLSYYMSPLISRSVPLAVTRQYCRVTANGMPLAFAKMESIATN